MNKAQEQPPQRKVRVFDLDDVPDGEARRVEVEGHKIAVVRIGEDLFAIGDMCSHANYSLSEGPVDPEEVTIECWKHGAQFSLCDGVPMSLPATQPVPVFKVESSENSIYIHIPEGSE